MTSSSPTSTTTTTACTTAVSQVSLPLPRSIDNRIFVRLERRDKSVMVFLMTGVAEQVGAPALGSFVYALPDVSFYLFLFLSVCSLRSLDLWCFLFFCSLSSALVFCSLSLVFCSLSSLVAYLLLFSCLLFPISLSPRLLRSALLFHRRRSQTTNPL